MATELNRETFIKIIKEDIKWLSQFPDCSEKLHIEMILNDVPNKFYEKEKRSCMNCVFNSIDHKDSITKFCSCETSPFNQIYLYSEKFKNFHCSEWRKIKENKKDGAKVKES